MTQKRRLRPRRPDDRQLSLGLGSGERYKLFFAVLPPPDIARQIDDATRALQQEFGLSRTPRIPHITLYGLGTYEDGIPHDIIAAVQNAASSVHARSFETIFDGVQVFASARQPVVLRCGKGLHGFVALQNAIGSTLAGAGADRGVFESSFTPHLTLFYGGGPIPERALQHPIGWTVEEFSLILSLQNHRHYEPYGTWKLRS